MVAYYTDTTSWDSVSWQAIGRIDTTNNMVVEVGTAYPLYVSAPWGGTDLDYHIGNDRYSYAESGGAIGKCDVKFTSCTANRNIYIGKLYILIGDEKGKDKNNTEQEDI